MSNRKSVEARVWKIRDVAEYLRVAPATIYRLLKQQKIPGFKIGAKWRFDADEIERWRLEQPIARVARKDQQ